MKLSQYTKETYDRFGKEYQKSRDEQKPERAFNEFYELPSMLKAVGPVRGKQLLDIGCGAGIHTQAYSRKGAKVIGCDISKTMVAMAKERYPKLKFEVCSMTKMQFQDARFDIVASSLAIHYIDDLDAAFREISRVLKRGGTFYFSTGAEQADFREVYEDAAVKVNAVGYVKLKRSGKKIPLGLYAKEGIISFEMVPGMLIRTHRRTFRTLLCSLRKAGFELIDAIYCEPTSEFKKRNPEDYESLKKFPIFTIYVARKK